MGTYKIDHVSTSHPTVAGGAGAGPLAGQPSQDYQIWCYRITFTPAAGEAQAFPRAIGDYYLNFKKGTIEPPIGPAPAGIDPTTWPGTTVTDPHPAQKGNTEYLHPNAAPTPVNNADGSVSLTFCFGTKTVKKAGEVNFSFDYQDASGFHILVDNVKAFAPLALADTGKDEQAIVALLASYEGIKSAATLTALLSEARGVGEGFLSIGENALARLRGREETPAGEEALVEEITDRSTG